MICDVPLVTIDGEDARDRRRRLQALQTGYGKQTVEGWRLLVAIMMSILRQEPGDIAGRDIRADLGVLSRAA